MKELMLLMGKALPKDFIVEEIEKAIAEWKIDQTDDKWRKLEMFCHLVLTKALTEGDGGLEGAIEQMGKAEKAYKLMNPESPNQ